MSDDADEGSSTEEYNNDSDAQGSDDTEEERDDLSEDPDYIPESPMDNTSSSSSDDALLIEGDADASHGTKRKRSHEPSPTPSPNHGDQGGNGNKTDDASVCSKRPRFLKLVEPLLRLDMWPDATSAKRELQDVPTAELNKLAMDMHSVSRKLGGMAMSVVRECVVRTSKTTERIRRERDTALAKVKEAEKGNKEADARRQSLESITAKFYSELQDLHKLSSASPPKQADPSAPETNATNGHAEKQNGCVTPIKPVSHSSSTPRTPETTHPERAPSSDSTNATIAETRAHPNGPEQPPSTPELLDYVLDYVDIVDLVDDEPSQRGDSVITPDQPRALGEFHIREQEHNTSGMWTLAFPEKHGAVSAHTEQLVPTKLSRQFWDPTSKGHYCHAIAWRELGFAPSVSDITGNYCSEWSAYHYKCMMQGCTCTSWALPYAMPGAPGDQDAATICCTCVYLCDHHAAELRSLGMKHEPLVAGRFEGVWKELWDDCPMRCRRRPKDAPLVCAIAGCNRVSDITVRCAYGPVSPQLVTRVPVCPAHDEFYKRAWIAQRSESETPSESQAGAPDSPNDERGPSDAPRLYTHARRRGAAPSRDSPPTPDTANCQRQAKLTKDMWVLAHPHLAPIQRYRTRRPANAAEIAFWRKQGQAPYCFSKAMSRNMKVLHKSRHSLPACWRTLQLSCGVFGCRNRGSPYAVHGDPKVHDNVSDNLSSCVFLCVEHVGEYRASGIKATLLTPGYFTGEWKRFWEYCPFFRRKDRHASASPKCAIRGCCSPPVKGRRVFGPISPQLVRHVGVCAVHYVEFKAVWILDDNFTEGGK